MCGLKFDKFCTGNVDKSCIVVEDFVIKYYVYTEKLQFSSGTFFSYILYAVVLWMSEGHYSIRARPCLVL